MIEKMFFSSFAGWNVLALSFNASPGNSTPKIIKECDEITIDGEIQSGDEYTFENLTKTVPYADIWLTGPGADVGAAIEIGKINPHSPDDATISSVFSAIQLT
jgi:hypothetical protein